jgi:hypothetical protein
MLSDSMRVRGDGLAEALLTRPVFAEDLESWRPTGAVALALVFTERFT